MDDEAYPFLVVASYSIVGNGSALSATQVAGVAAGFAIVNGVAPSDVTVSIGSGPVLQVSVVAA